MQLAEALLVTVSWAVLTYLSFSLCFEAFVYTNLSAALLVYNLVLALERTLSFLKGIKFLFEWLDWE